MYIMCKQRVLPYILNIFLDLYTQMYEYSYGSSNIKENPTLQSKGEYTIVKSNNLYRIIYPTGDEDKETQVKVEKVENPPFMYMSLTYDGSDQNIVDIYEEVKKYLVKGNIIDKKLICYILRTVYDVHSTDLDIKILNREVTFETLLDDFSFQLI
jgi:hypothetical protein